MPVSLRQQPSTERIAPRFLPAMETHDADTHRACVTGWRGVYEHVGRESFHGHVTELWMRPIQIIRERLDRPCVWRGGAWPGAVVFLAVREAHGNFSVSGRALPLSAVTVLPRDVSTEGFSSAPVDSLGVAVSEAALIEFAKRHGGLSAVEIQRSMVIDDPTAVATFQACLNDTLEELQECPELLADLEFRRDVEARVLRLLSTMLQNHLSTAHTLSPPTTRSYVVEKAAQYMEARLAEPLEIPDLCRALRVCPRTLRYSFEEVLGVSPTEYLMSLRLGRVRRALLHSSKSASVKYIASRFGFSHMGRFARFYREAYGEKPSETLQRRARGVARIPRAARVHTPRRSDASQCEGLESAI
jgi:AraC family ethanolamine operon transcriptional activator